MSRFFQTSRTTRLIFTVGFFGSVFCALLLTGLFCSSVVGQEAVEDLNQLVDQKVDIRLTKDVYFVDAIVTSVISERLSVTRDRLWKPLTDPEQEAFMVSHRKFIKKVQSDTPGLRLVETEFFLFLTDLNDKDLTGYIGYLDEMYVELCKAFGLSPEKNIWCGKCVVVAFETKVRYLRFEKVHMGFASADGTQGLCHQFGDGRVIFAGYQGTGDFAHVLVHETAHGFVHRYLSSARAPSWLNEGMSDWLAGKIVKSDRNAKDQRHSARIIKARGGIGDLLTVPRISGDQYGASNAMVEILSKIILVLAIKTLL